MKSNSVYTLKIDEWQNKENRAVCTMAFGYDSYVPHNHDFIEMVYVKVGKGKHLIQGRKVEIKAGDSFIMVKKDYVHSIQPLNPNDFVIYNLLIPFNLFNVDIEKLPPDFVFSSNIIEGLGNMFEAIRKEEVEKQSGYADVINSYTTIILEKLSRYYNSIYQYSRKNKDVKYDYIQIAKNYIDNNYTKAITIDDIANVCGCSKLYLQELFKKKSYRSMKQYLMDKRLIAASHLLLHDPSPIESVAVNVGFNDIRYFYRLFNKQFHMTPTDYRNKYKVA